MDSIVICLQKISLVSKCVCIFHRRLNQNVICIWFLSAYNCKSHSCNLFHILLKLFCNFVCTKIRPIFHNDAWIFRKFKFSIIAVPFLNTRNHFWLHILILYFREQIRMFLSLFRDSDLKRLLCHIFFIFFIYHFQHDLHAFVIVHIIITDFTIICNYLRIFTSDYVNLITFRHLRQRHFFHIRSDRLQTFDRIQHFFCTFRLIRNLRSVDLDLTHRDTVSTCLRIYFIKFKAYIPI